MSLKPANLSEAASNPSNRSEAASRKLNALNTYYNTSSSGSSILITVLSLTHVQHC